MTISCNHFSINFCLIWSLTRRGVAFLKRGSLIIGTESSIAILGAGTAMSDDFCTLIIVLPKGEKASLELCFSFKFPINPGEPYRFRCYGEVLIIYSSSGSDNLFALRSLLVAIVDNFWASSIARGKLSL